MALLLEDIDAGDFYARFASRMNTGQTEIDAFLKDPTGFMFKTVGLRTGSGIGDRLRALPASQVSQGNAFLMTLLANPGFVDWMRSYNGDMAAKVMAADFATPQGQDLKRQLIEDFARAMIDHGELRLFIDMIRAGGDASLATTLDTDPLVSVSAWYDGVAVDVETFIYAVLAVAVAAAITIALVQFDLSIPVEVPEQARATMTANEMRNLSQQLLDEAQRLYGPDADG